jgi:L-alanine-DL-glutamate epimerase-like enolase superfamily enzyme
LHENGINVKLTKCGGLTPAKRMITKARELGMKVMVGSMNEGAIGTSAAAHLLPLLDYADMDGTLLLAEDVGTGITIENGKINYSETNGIGVVVNDF